ncbi:amidohydrolase family protein [Luteimonas sp. RD2P54]|uniref:Amidohydrolase family protein n=1 Tax=Luteimonas endophytica TaxID=3042023 RepID=A0ABT6JDR5_9GAMM|nr:amidohydrolase family protein [Luteimonas endophytica]MDH5824969.1 amidohydrolase family protein [Luteimonas endophytica]
MKRRALLGGVMGLGGVGALGRLGAAGLQAGGDVPGLQALRATTASLDAIRGVDAHCHIFNASDLLVGPFVSEVEAKANPDSPLGYVVGKVAKVFQRFAPTAREEMKWLARRPLAQALAPSDAWMAQGRFMHAMEASAEDSDDRFREVWEAIAEEEPDAYEAFFDDYAQLQDRAIRGSGLAGSAFVTSNQLAKGVRDNPELANFLVTEELKPRSGAAPILAFLKTFVRYRYENAMTLMALHGGSSERPIGLYTPAMVDFDLWIGPARCSEATPSPIADQIALSARIAQATNHQVRCLAPFNPLRAAVDEGYFDLMEGAVTTYGCLGFKIYPPMGFSPWQNPDGMARRLDCGTRVTGARLDAMMERFFALCARHRAPILAHGSPSNSPGGDAARALLGGPDNWARTFERFPEYFGGGDPAVKVCIAHFGGISTPAHTRGWADRLAALMEVHPCLYADTSYLDGLLSSGAGHEALLERLTQALATPVVRERMMYGSDWSMLAKEPGVENYPVLLSRALDRIAIPAEDKEAIFVGNAFRFYALDAGGEGRVRFLEGAAQ